MRLPTPIPATGGLDRAVRFWNPYITGKPIAVSIINTHIRSVFMCRHNKTSLLAQVLKGHTAAILHIAINSCGGQVISFSKDMVSCLHDYQFTDAS